MIYAEATDVTVRNCLFENNTGVSSVAILIAGANSGSYNVDISHLNVMCCDFIDFK